MFEMHDGWSSGMGFGMWIFWIAIIIVIVMILKSISGSGSSSDEKPKEDPFDILKRRYASGEISREEFEQLKKDLS